MNSTTVGVDKRNVRVTPLLLALLMASTTSTANLEARAKIGQMLVNSLEGAGND